MAKDQRLYGKFTLDFSDNPKIAILSDAAFRCLVEATLWSRKQERDGLLPRRYAIAKWSLDVLQELATNDDANPSLIEREEGWWIHDYAEHQDTKAEIAARREKNRIAGHLGGLAKAKRGAKQPASATLSESLPEEEEEEENLTTANAVVKKPRKRVSRLSDTDYPRAFEEWWSLYPRKDSKRKALEAWQRARRRATDDELNYGAERYAQDPNRQDKYTKQPTTWLNGDCWLSESLPAVANGHPPHKMRNYLELANEVRAHEQAQLENQQQRAIE